VLVSEPFVSMAKAQAVTLEYPAARLVVFPHPLAGLDEDGVRARAQGVVDEVVARLLDPAA
jgi:hypothetical protein